MPYWIELLLGLVLALMILLLALRCTFAKAWTRPWRLRGPLRRRVCIQGDLLVAPRCLTEARLPFDPAQQPRLRSGALLWASAATVTHTLANERDRQAILAAVKPLGFTPEQFLARCPILGEVTENDQPGYVVRDGSGYRAYFLGEPAALMDACQFVWDQQEREKTPDDVARLPDPASGLYALAMAPACDEGVGPLTYLGAMRIAAPLRDTAPVDLLRAQVKQLAVTPSIVASEHNAALQALGNASQPLPHALMVGLDCAEHSFVVDDPDDPTWARQVADGFALALSQRRICLRLALTLLLLSVAAALWTLPWWLLPLSAALLLPRCILRASAVGKRTRPASAALTVRLVAACLWAAAAPLALRNFAAYAAPASAALALPLAYGAAAAVLGLTRRPAWALAASLCAGVFLTAGMGLWLQPPLLLGAFCLVAGLLHGAILRLLMGTDDSSFPGNCS